MRITWCILFALVSLRVSSSSLADELTRTELAPPNYTVDDSIGRLEGLTSSRDRDPADNEPTKVLLVSFGSDLRLSDSASKLQDENGATTGSSLDRPPGIEQAFPVSASVEADCQRRKDEICDENWANLAQFSKEPRDPAWAPNMEALIRDDVLSQERPGRFRVRRIECRTSVCAAEIESSFEAHGVHGGYMGGIQAGHEAIKKPLRTHLSTFALEKDSSGRRMTVTLITFTRRK